MAYLEKRSHLKSVPISRKPELLPEDKITPEHLFLSRRKFIIGVGAAAATAFLAACLPRNSQKPDFSQNPMGDGTADTGSVFCDDALATGTADELNNPLTSCNDIVNYNNFYEFSYNKENVAGLSENFKTSPWEIKVSGLVNKPGTFSIEELAGKYQPVERIYRMRCVEAWSMVVPWLGFPLNKLLNDVQPKPEAKYVRFESFYDRDQMTGDPSLPFPYFEGLRLDEAMHDLTILATGLYGKPLPPQEGAPIRLVVPWKYGFKSAKSIVNIELTDKMPPTFWSNLSPREYGFYANVNPEVDHPRWSQSSERRLGELQRIPTLMFNGYEKVASLYEGMDLTVYY
jgi:sulfoxide reductase catalytic subunit YedY